MTVDAIMATLDAAGVPRVPPPMYFLEVVPERRAGRGRWWASDGRGYTDDIARAGLYPEVAAKATEARSDRTVAVAAEPMIRQALEQALRDARVLRERLRQITSMPEPRAEALPPAPAQTNGSAIPPPAETLPPHSAGGDILSREAPDRPVHNGASTPPPMDVARVQNVGGGVSPGGGGAVSALRDAKPGQKLRDKDGDTWTRLDCGARIEFTGPRSERGDPPCEWYEDDLDGDDGADQFGPFTPLEPKP